MGSAKNTILQIQKNLNLRNFLKIKLKDQMYKNIYKVKHNKRIAA